MGPRAGLSAWEPVRLTLRGLSLGPSGPVALCLGEHGKSCSCRIISGSELQVAILESLVSQSMGCDYTRVDMTHGTDRIQVQWCMLALGQAACEARGCTWAEGAVSGHFQTLRGLSRGGSLASAFPNSPQVLAARKSQQFFLKTLIIICHSELPTGTSGESPLCVK